MMNNNNNPINISKLTIENLDGFIYPVLHIIHFNKKGERDDDNYLMPFRLYSFQVCGTIDGECDMGSSECHRFIDILNYSNYEDRLKKMLCRCLNAYVNTCYGYPGRLVRFSYNSEILCNDYQAEQDAKKNINIYNTETYEINNMPFMDKFIEASIMATKKYYNIA